MSLPRTLVKTTLPILLALAALPVRSQVKSLMVSCYDNVLRLDFSTAPPSIIYTGVGGGFEGSAHAEDIDGNMIFWAQATGMYDATNTLMPGSVGMFANPSSAEINICPVPGDPDRYYVIYNAETCTGLYYSIVDMTLNGGLGDVTDLNTPITTTGQYAEGLEIVRIPCAADSVWFLAFNCDEGLYRFTVTTTGFTNPTLLQSYVPPFSYDGRSELDYHLGHVGMAFAWTNATFLADFDPTTGALSNFNEVIMPFPSSGGDGMYGMEFSPDGTHAYTSRWYYQSDPNFFVLDLATMSVVQSLHITPDGAPFFTSLGEIELGPDGNLYMAIDGSNVVKVIQNSNTPATLAFSEIVTTSQVALGMDDPIQSDLSGIVVDPGVIELDPFFPNVFSPNGDGENDEYRVGNVNFDYVSYFLMKVFNRWGQEIFRGTNAKQGWDGKGDGGEAPDGVYYYIVDISYEVVGCHGELVGARTIPTEKGWVQILR